MAPVCCGMTLPLKRCDLAWERLQGMLPGRGLPGKRAHELLPGGRRMSVRAEDAWRRASGGACSRTSLLRRPRGDRRWRVGSATRVSAAAAPAPTTGQPRRQPRERSWRAMLDLGSPAGGAVRSREKKRRVAREDAGRHRIGKWRNRLPIAALHDHGVLYGVDNHRVVNVIRDNVQRRGRNVDRPVDPDRQRLVHRHGKDENVDRRRRRGQIDDVGRRRRQDDHRRRRRQVEVGVGKGQDRPIDNVDLVRRRRRQIVLNLLEGRRRRQGDGKPGKPAMAVGFVRPIGVAPQMRPVRLGGPNVKGAPPRECFPTGGDERPHAPSQRVARIGV